VTLNPSYLYHSKTHDEVNRNRHLPGTAAVHVRSTTISLEPSMGIPREINTLCFNALLLARAAEQKQVDSKILQEVVADLDLDRIRLNTGMSPSGMHGVHTANELSLGNTAEDPPPTSIDKNLQSHRLRRKRGGGRRFHRACVLMKSIQSGTMASEILSKGSGETSRCGRPGLRCPYKPQRQSRMNLFYCAGQRHGCHDRRCTRRR
jgi:hypothetical protein